jgi:exopolyphosphatase/guanosine-5'-triphosphate,3'-diphosphate pyrophosphatase
MQAGVDAVRALIDEARGFPLDAIQLVATSAVREAANGEQFRRDVEAATGQPLTVLSGEAEARAIARGVAGDPMLAELRAFEIVDLGGGSLEVIRFRDQQLEMLRSFPVGAVRLLEELVTDAEQAIPEQERAAIRARIAQCMAALPPVPEPGAGPGYEAVGTGGAFTVSRAILAGRAGLSFDQQSSFLALADLEALGDELACLPLAERMRIPGLPPRRADILPAALLALVAYARGRMLPGFHHSLCNLRYGVATAWLADADEAGSTRGGEV